MYQNPIELVRNQTEEMMQEIDRQTGEMVVKACLSLGVNVNRDELIKMAQYDRGQYDKGYKDGLTEGVINTLQGLLDKIDRHMENVTSSNPMYLLGQRHIRDIVEMVINETLEEGKDDNST